MKPTPPLTRQAKKGAIDEAVYGLGKVKSKEIYEYKSAVSKTIQKLFVREGSLVNRGDRLIQFDEGPAVLAPFQGTVTFLPFREKENIFPSAALVRIENLENSYIEVALEQQGALRIQREQKARLSFESFRGQLFQGIVESIYPAQDQFLVRINPEKLPKAILPGMTADVAIEMGSRQDVLLVPISAISMGKLTKIQNGKSIKIPVEIGSSDGEWGEVIRGDVQAGDSIVVPGKK
ncbi:MAG: efflux RND transporter periplasmic adaptor subunit [Bdellovibrionales bacterium]